MKEDLYKRALHASLKVGEKLSDFNRTLGNVYMGLWCGAACAALVIDYTVNEHKK